MKKVIKKAGTILLNFDRKEICLIKKNNEYSFLNSYPNDNETLIECTFRIIKECFYRKSYILNSNEYVIYKYTNSFNENVECYYYLAIDLGNTDSFIKVFDKNVYQWVPFNKVSELLSFDNLKELWQKIMPKVVYYFDNYINNINYKENYFIFNSLELKHAFFIKPYNFNSNIISPEKLNEELNNIKDVLDINKIALVKQEHTSIIKKVTLENYNIEEVADALITNIKSIGLAIKVADCQAIFLYDPIKKVIGNVHSGWKGTIDKIVGKAINCMVSDYGCNINTIMVYINPSIAKCHFEVDYDVYEKFISSFTEIDIKEYIGFKDKKYYIDTKLINKAYLIYLGIKEDNIEISSMCTVCNGCFVHSYRYDKENSGRNLSVISL